MPEEGEKDPDDESTKSADKSEKRSGAHFFHRKDKENNEKGAVTKTEVGQLSFQGNERERSVLKGRMNLFQGRQSGVAKKGKQRSLNEPFSKSVSSVECDKVDFY